jgi:hypothetical protein
MPADTTVCVMRDGYRQDTVVEDLVKGDLVCIGCLYRVVEVKE